MLSFEKNTIQARMVLPDGQTVARPIEVRRNPITGRTCRITISRSEEREPGTSALPDPPPFAADRSGCPFCPGALTAHTPRLSPELCPSGRMHRGQSVLFPNLFPYGSYSAVSLFDDRHFTEIGTASPDSYSDCFLNCRDYLLRILEGRVAAHFRETGARLFYAYLEHERQDGSRYIGRTGSWEWMAAFAPEGFFEIWGILPGVTSIRQAEAGDWRALASGVVQVQKFYRSLNRNGYNLGLLSIEDGSDMLELRVVLVVRSNYAAWVRSDHTGFEVMLGDMATFTAPEQTAQLARPFWNDLHSY
jgi:UDPglucose--hexose-1-phosphate uridylyltransferase